MTHELREGIGPFAFFRLNARSARAWMVMFSVRKSSDVNSIQFFIELNCTLLIAILLLYLVFWSLLVLMK